MQIYLHEDLKEYCKDVKNIKQRSFVNTIIGSLKINDNKNNEYKTYCITGMYNTGKTTSLLQIISNYKYYGIHEDLALIELNYFSDKFDLDLLYNLVEKLNKKFIFIDNIDTLISWENAEQDLIKLKKFNNLDSIVVFTSSINLELNSNRIFYNNDIINFVCYNEFQCIINNKKAKSYIKYNGDKLFNYFSINMLTELVNLCKSDTNIKVRDTKFESRMTCALYRIFHNIAYLNLYREVCGKDGYIRKHIYDTYRNIVDFMYEFDKDEVLLKEDTEGMADFDKLAKFYSGYTKASKKDIKAILNALIKNNIIIEIKDFEGKRFSDYYFTNNYLARQVFKLLPKVYKDDCYTDTIHDALVKNSLATNLSKANKIMGLETYSFHDVLITVIQPSMGNIVYIKECINTFDTIHYEKLVDFDAHVDYLERLDKELKQFKFKNKEIIVVHRYIVESSMRNNKMLSKNGVNITYSSIQDFLDYMLYN